MSSYTNISKNTSSYSNPTKNRSSILVYLLTEDDEYMTQEDDGYIACEYFSEYIGIDLLLHFKIKWLTQKKYHN
jgi:hypothetical protein